MVFQEHRRIIVTHPKSRVARVAAGLMLAPLSVLADGIVIDRIYDPYVQPLETELEWRSLLQSDDDLGDVQKHSFGIGRGWTDRWATEFYAIGTKTEGESISVDAYELEVKWQLTEQGEFAFDWGVLFELEREVQDDVWELSGSLIASRDFGQWTGIANIGLIYEWGSGVQNEIETALHVQTRYRLKESFEPAIELHVGQDTVALGPAIIGLGRLSPGKKLRWEAGIFFGLDNQSPDQTIKLNIEFEF